MSIKIENTETHGFKAAIRGMRNPMNSWDRSDSIFSISDNDDIFAVIGANDYKLMENLREAGTDHRKFMRMIVVYTDIIAPLYWWKEFDTYKVGTVANSCSTMHKIMSKEFTIDDFSHEHLTPDSIDVLQHTVDFLNGYRRKYCEEKDEMLFWWQAIQSLPSSYNQRRTVMMNYEVLANIYKSRKNHKLHEWRKLCEWIKTLPYAELITGEKVE